MAINGLVVMTPSSIAYSGTSASINADGSVDFSAVTSLSLNGVFTSDYDNYMVVMGGTSITSPASIYWRLRASNSDNSTSSSYTFQDLQAYSTTVAASRGTDSQGLLFPANNEHRSASTLYVFGPKLAQATAWRTVSVNDGSGSRLFDAAGTHNQSTSYDGFTLIPYLQSMSALVTVFAFNN